MYWLENCMPLGPDAQPPEGNIMKQLFILAVLSLLPLNSALGAPLFLTPPVGLNIDGIDIMAGVFELTAINIISPGGDGTPTGPQFMNIGDTDQTLVGVIPDDTTQMQLLGYFDASIPDIPAILFDITIIGMVPGMHNFFTYFLPENIVDPVTGVNFSTIRFLQATALFDPDDLGDNIDNFSNSTVPQGHGTGSTIPEPATLVLFGLGLVGVGFSTRRKV